MAVILSFYGIVRREFRKCRGFLVIDDVPETNPPEKNLRIIPGSTAGWEPFKVFDVMPPKATSSG
jgi:hypothetical protein